MSEQWFELPPAFPSHGSMGEVAQEGMSLRDYFAAAALQGLTSACNENGYWTGNGIESAKEAYLIADAMLAERNK